MKSAAVAGDEAAAEPLPRELRARGSSLEPGRARSSDLPVELRADLRSVPCLSGLPSSSCRTCSRRSSAAAPPRRRSAAARRQSTARRVRRRSAPQFEVRLKSVCLSLSLPVDSAAQFPVVFETRGATFDLPPLTCALLGVRPLDPPSERWLAHRTAAE